MTDYDITHENELEHIAIANIQACGSNIEIEYAYFYANSKPAGRFKCAVIFHYGIRSRAYSINCKINFDRLYTDSGSLKEFLKEIIKTLSRENVGVGLGCLNTTDSDASRREIKKHIKRALRNLPSEEEKHAGIAL